LAISEYFEPEDDIFVTQDEDASNLYIFPQSNLPRDGVQKGRRRT
jgi:hypothetical protein